jgi:hypothetical protein
MAKYRLTFTGICIVEAASANQASDELVRIADTLEDTEPTWVGYRNWDVEEIDEEAAAHG